MAWLKLSFSVPNEKQEELIAWLQLSGADSIVELDGMLEAYCLEEDYKSLIEELGKHIPDLTHQKDIVEDKNWNAIWESQFEPVVIGDIHIRATFHPKQQGKEIIIMPKMAFGTGHHATTYMMINELASMQLSGSRVLDYGCGTGILSVMACMQGADHLECIDIQPEAVENTIEHFDINGISSDRWSVSQGDLDILGEGSYELILANINKSVLKSVSRELYNLTSKGGKLMLSGILNTDCEEIKSLYNEAGFNCDRQIERDAWVCLVFNKSSQHI